MALTNPATGLEVQKWDARFFTEFVQENRFSVYFGTNMNAMIQIREDLATRPAKTITFPLVNRLTGAGVTGDNTLVDNEESMTSRSFDVTITQKRNAVAYGNQASQYSAISLRDASRDVLMTWEMERVRDRIIATLGAINGTAYGSASEAAKDAWLVDNADRVLFGSAVSNNSSNDHSASLANVDTTNDKATTANISLLKRRAKLASPKIRPIRTAGDEEWYVYFAHPYTMRDLKTDTALTNATRDARARGRDNPLFTGADFIWDGIIIREIDDLSILTGVGASTSDVAINFLCGAQAIGYGIAQRTQTRERSEDDYGNVQGLAVVDMDGIDKMLFGSGSGDTDDLKDHGVATHYVSAPAD